MRGFELDRPAKVLRQKLQQHAIELLSVEDPRVTWEADERARYGGHTTEEIGRALEERWQCLVAREEALEAATGKDRG